MLDFKVRDPDRDEEWEDALGFFDAEMVALHAAEDYDRSDAAYGNERTIEVDDGSCVRTFIVTSEMMPRYSARER